MNASQSKLLQKAYDSIRGANGLNEMGLAHIAVSRAYYAMFYVAQAFLLTKGLTYSKHSGVISAFGQHFAKLEIIPAKYHQYLREAKEDRLVGDYDLEATFTKDEAREQISRAEEFLHFAESWLAEPS